MQEKKSFSGCYGMVILPTKKTIKIIQQITKNLDQNLNFLTKIPHLTLYYANFKNIPKSFILKKLEVLNRFKKIKLNLQEIQVYGDKFLFLNIVEKEKLQEPHLIALGLNKYLDKSKIPNAKKENLTLSKEEKKNLKTYGHPLVKNLYLPHVTMAYNTKGFKKPLPKEKLIHFEIDEFVFARIGEFGAVEEVVLTKS